LRRGVEDNVWIRNGGARGWIKFYKREPYHLSLEGSEEAFRASPRLLSRTILNVRQKGNEMR
jgi:hypothetical protein